MTALFVKQISVQCSIQQCADKIITYASRATFRALNQTFLYWLSIVNGFQGAVSVSDDAEATVRHVR